MGAIARLVTVRKRAGNEVVGTSADGLDQCSSLYGEEGRALALLLINAKRQTPRSGSQTADAPPVGVWWTRWVRPQGTAPSKDSWRRAPDSGRTPRTVADRRHPGGVAGSGTLFDNDAGEWTYTTHRLIRHITERRRSGPRISL